MGLLSVLSPVTMLAGKGSDHLTPVITGLQDKVNKLTGSPSFTADQLAQIRKDIPGIQTNFDQANAKGGADKNSPVYKQKGLDNIDSFTQYWFDHIRNPNDYAGPTSTDPTPQQAADDVTTKATSETDKLVQTYKDLTASLTAQIGKQQTDTTKLIGDLQGQFASKQGSLLSGFQEAQATQAKQMGDLINQMNSTGQQAKRPNYGAALQKNRELNSQGLAATMLTGPGGVSPGALSLGFTSLLGGGR